MPAIAPSQATLAARSRRIDAAKAATVRWEWFLNKVVGTVRMTMEKRVRLATDFLRDTVVRNISIPVVKGTGPISGRVVVTERSSPGEFPRADTTTLMKTTFSDVRFVDGAWEGYVGSPLDYSLFLELKMNRSFLVRTLNERRDDITRILTGPIV